jgi:hypothetical protein
MTSPSGIPIPEPRPGAGVYQTDRDNEKVDLLKKIVGLLTALALLALVSVIVQVVGLVGANQTSDEISDRLDDIRQNTATP